MNPQDQADRTRKLLSKTSATLWGLSHRMDQGCGNPGCRIQKPDGIARNGPCHCTIPRFIDELLCVAEMLEREGNRLKEDVERIMTEIQKTQYREAARKMIEQGLVKPAEPGDYTPASSAGPTKLVRPKPARMRRRTWPKFDVIGLPPSRTTSPV